ncbi:C-terminal processing protease CtpA/Prc [Anseongella ginsenosidimutans]|uniref:C-terminal processing protease CtpA/Prc n=2 Tax=Anseongella ginsenosidimutans TaxID=496056 RepID=A0A4R3KPL9_9SPHI|nr:C-terminal processing protease CtpA/Prc [Anseongella ginsenosidimutans]
MAALCCAALIASCQKDDVPGQVKENRRVNDWILVNMEREYYWNDDIPANPNMDQDPLEFFESILSSEDRFSWIQESGDELSDNLSGKFESFGYEVKLYYRTNDPNDNRIAAVVVYAYDGSDAASKGLERGMWIGEVNGEELTDGNYTELLFDTGQPQELAVGQLDAEGNFTTEETVTVQATEIQENPIHYHNIIEHGGRKVGYLVYNSFIPGPADDTDEIYDQALKDIFSNFKAGGVNELILDLRYNLGGAVSSATKLAGYIMQGYQEDKIFAIYEDNEEELMALPVSIFYEEGETPPNLGTLNRLYVLVSTNTASASELIINGLKPYMEVTLIGDDVTVGKNVASTTITDQRRNIPENERIKYGLQPIIYKIYNSQMESDFEEGFEPDINVEENFAPFGDMNESFLSAALSEISGGVVTAESLRKLATQHGQEIGSSLDRKPGAGEMFVKPWELPSQK